jgi:hypothetical protein
MLAPARLIDARELRPTAGRAEKYYLLLNYVIRGAHVELKSVHRPPRALIGDDLGYPVKLTNQIRQRSRASWRCSACEIPHSGTVVSINRFVCNAASIGRREPRGKNRIAGLGRVNDQF